MKSKRASSKVSAFWLVAEGTYGGGVALVLAADMEEARILAAREIPPDVWECRWHNAKVTPLPFGFMNSPAVVIEHNEHGE